MRVTGWLRRTLLAPDEAKHKRILAESESPRFSRLARAGRAAYGKWKQENSSLMSDGVNKFLGDSPLRVLVKLVVVSILVGFVMTVFDWRPMDLLDGIRDFVVDLWRTGFAALGRVGDYLLLGAAVVIPAFIILRLFSYRR
jgi:hypothetical protein